MAGGAGNPAADSGEGNPYRSLATVQQFQAFAHASGVEVPLQTDGDISALFTPLDIGGRTVGNRFCILPMEGWDCGSDGRPTEAAETRWRRQGASGVKLLWTESAAVSEAARSSGAQLIMTPPNVASLSALRSLSVAAHNERLGRTDDLIIGIQLHHSGRLCREPDGTRTPLVVQHHPFLDEKYGVAASAPLVSDDDLWALIDTYVDAARCAQAAGFDFVDLKACHGYLIHELLTAHTRPGRFGGSFENRTRFLLEVTRRIRTELPDLMVAVRLSAFEIVAHTPGPDGIGHPFSDDPYPFAFGSDAMGQSVDSAEPIRLVQQLQGLGVPLVCISGASPYALWHYQRPARLQGASDYATPEPPLVGVARHLAVTAAIKQACPGLVVVGSAYSMLQQWLPAVGAAAINAGMTDVVGYARLHLAYPDLVADLASGAALDLDAMWGRF